MTIADFDHLSEEDKNKLLGMCCSSTGWIKKMLAIFPIQNLVDLLEYAEEEWYDCNEADWLEAFNNHIKIGDIMSIENNTAANAEWVKDEQTFINHVSPEQIDELQKGNKLYEDTFGYNFIIATKGKTFDNILENLFSRLENDAQDELVIAAGEENKITRQRLQRLFA